MTETMRDCVVGIIEKDLLGPGAERLCGYDPEHEIVVTERVSDRYAVGVLYPQQGQQSLPEPPSKETDADSEEDEADVPEDASITDSARGGAQDSDYEDVAALSRAFKPSAMGMTFYVSGLDGVSIEATAAQYRWVHDLEPLLGAKVEDLGCVLLLGVDADEITWLKERLSDALVSKGIVFSSADGKPCIRRSRMGSVERLRDWLLDDTARSLFSSAFLSALESLDFSAKEKCSVEKILSAYRGAGLGQADRLEPLEAGFRSEVARLRALVALYVAADRLRMQAETGWKRCPLSAAFDMRQIGGMDVPVGERIVGDASFNFENHEVCDGIKLVVECVREREYAYRLAVSIVNTFISEADGRDRIFCQPKVVCEGPGKIIPTRESRALTQCDEDKILEMLYRNFKCYGRGRGCSVKWHEDSDGVASRIETTYLPTKAIKAPDWNVYPKELEKELQDTALSAGYLRLEENRVGALRALDRFVTNYERWIEERKAEILKDADLSEGEFKKSAQTVVARCGEAARRMRKGLETLLGNEKAYKAFRLANEAMYMTRQWREKTADVCFRWRQFQLGFILVSLSSLVDKTDPDRGTVDLLWFPTGGGKTEAYLGLTALGIFYRYLTERNPAGTSVIMRYTLRLLASQQFSRACALICACDEIRSHDPEMKGKPRITIGLWIGSSTIPNTIAGAKEIGKKLQTSKIPQSHPFQPEACPKCCRRIYDVNERHKSCYDFLQNEFRIFCQNPECSYHRFKNPDGMPVQIIDECLYKEPPTLLFGTVDKFAQLSHKEHSAFFFGLDGAVRVNPPPDLIIQDELHLISEELGTLVGLFETAVAGLCEAAGGSMPKIVASTATVRRATEQCTALFAAEKVAQFPPPGLDARDSYFSRESEKDGRLYLGVESSGQTTSTTLIRLMAMLLFRSFHLDLPEYGFEKKSLKELDKYFTLVTYFNSLRELGACETWVNSDIYERIKGMAKREGLAMRMLDPKRTAVMCSRTESSEIKDMLEELQKATLETVSAKKHPKDVVLASNMLSVGLDVDRFCLMVMNGQPKKNAEFIQASSRVGRNDIGLGLVVTLYSGTKVRDRSYFELFPDYVQSFYKYVEPTTITPFTRAARKRLLKPIVATLVRHLVPDFEGNDFSRASAEDLRARKAMIRSFFERRLDRLVRGGVESERTKEWTLHDFESAFDEFAKLVEEHQVTQYDTRTLDEIPTDRVLFYSAKKGRARWEGVSSLRHVDKSVSMELIEPED